MKAGVLGSGMVGQAISARYRNVLAHLVTALGRAGLCDVQCQDHEIRRAEDGTQNIIRSK